MPEVTSHEAGTANWVEMNSPNVGASQMFYRGLFGWDSYVLVDPVAGEYEMFTLDGVTGPEVAGLTDLADDSLPPTWTCYFTVRDIAATLEVVRSAGGQVFVDGLKYGNMGTLGLAGDTEGAGFGLWQPGELLGAAVVD